MAQPLLEACRCFVHDVCDQGGCQVVVGRTNQKRAPQAQKEASQMPRLSEKTKVERAVRAFEKVVRKVIKCNAPHSCWQCKECGQVYVEANLYGPDKCWACGAGDWAKLWSGSG